ncbi:MAG: cytochrome C oxidase subunit IV family protein [bacterium]
MESHGQHEEHVHRVSYGHYLLIWLGLIVLTGATVSLAGIELGHWIIITSLSIASIKAALVLGIFMHLKFEDKIFRIFVLVAVVTLMIFIVLTFFDYAFR